MTKGRVEGSTGSGLVMEAKAPQFRSRHGNPCQGTTWQGGPAPVMEARRAW